jgi:hypothetical protein
MSVRVYLSGNPVHDRVLEAFFEGCPNESELVQGWKYEPSDIAVIFGVYKSKIKQSWPRGRIFRQQREKNLDVIVLETGYINRGDGEHHHYAAGFNGLNGRADFRNKSMGPERLEKLGVQLRPYSPGEKVILCGQVPWDASVDNHDHKAWIIETAKALRVLTKRPVVFRPHPLASLPAIAGLEYSTKPLQEDLKTAHCVVTYNSNSGVEALIDGKAVFAFDEGSMVWDLANKNLGDVEAPKYDNRTQWAKNLAFAQWTAEEMRQGLAWRHLTR